MTYTPTTWSDRIVENPLTYQLQDNGDGTHTLVPAPGTITQAGTPVNAARLNNIETGINVLSNEALKLWKTMLKSMVIANATLYNYNDVVVDSLTDILSIATATGEPVYDAAGDLYIADWSVGSLDGAQVGGSTGSAIYGTTMRAQTVTPSKSGHIRTVKMYFNAATGSPTADQICEIRTTSAGLPTATVLSTATIPAASITPDALNTFTFATPVAVTAGTVYALVFKSPSANSSNCFPLKSNSSGSYAGGQYASTSDGTTWTADAARDLTFEFYLTPGDTVVITTVAFTASTSTARAMLSAITDTPAGVTVVYEASANNGTNWTTVTLDNAATIAMAGTQIKVRISATWDNATAAVFRLYGYGIAFGGAI